MSSQKQLLLLYIFIPTIFVKASDITIASCNLWNVMFNWEIRFRMIADIIREHEIDVIFFQEVHLNDGGKEGTQRLSSQLNEFRMLLPQHKWVFAYPAGTLSKINNSYKTEWNTEGLGILSRRQIIHSDVVQLKQSLSSMDRNSRIALHSRIQLGPQEKDVLDVVGIHFSYDPHQQCQNANDVIKFIRDANWNEAVVLGDFNAYGRVSPSVNLFLHEKSSCPIYHRNAVGNFKDAWLEMGNNHTGGLTFSNMPTPGLQSRPDRILISKSIKVIKADIVGDGVQYRQDYHVPILLNRASTVIKTSFEAFSSYRGFSCLHDCGPHGSCRCGVCVSGGDRNACLIPSCSECSSGKFILLIALLIPAIICFVIALIALIRILVISGRFSQKDVQDILGHRCCLFNRQLFHVRVFPRRFRISLCHCLQLYNLPPFWVFLAVSVLQLLWFFMFKHFFKDSIDLIYSIIPEEYFPSDHKVIIAKLSI